MKAIRVHTPGGPEVMKLEEIAEPTAAAGQAVVKIEAAGLNYIDVYFRSGTYKAPLPLTPGLEGAGTVTAVGAGVTDVKVGDRVAYTGIPGSYAQVNVCPADRLVKLPDKLTFRDGAASMLQGMTAHYLTRSTYPLKKGDTALVHAAAGGMGLLLTQMAKMFGATVIGTVSTDEKAALAKQAGADHVILYSKQDFEAEVKRITGGRGVDVIYDGVGATTFDKGLNCLRPRGVMALYGAASGPVPPVDPQRLNAAGSVYLTRPMRTHFNRSYQEFSWRAGELFDAIAAVTVTVTTGERYDLRDAAQAHRDLEDRRTTGSTVLTP